MKWNRLYLFVCLLPFWGVGCAVGMMNQPVDKIDPDTIRSQFSAAVHQRTPDMNFSMAFSGGGTRAAALAYGVLETLESIRLPANAHLPERSMLDEVDFITSVSGGSFVSGYYGLYGKKIFENFRQDFLYRDIDRALLFRMLSPMEWVRFLSASYDRADMAATYYDSILFKNKTFADFIPVTQGPAIEPQATEIVEGRRFGFDPHQFAVICSDLGAFPVSRAVTASSAFPGAFSSITLKNYAGRCGYEMPQWMKTALANRANPNLAFPAARRTELYLDVKREKYIHLMDGGVSDNLGIRSPLENMGYGYSDEEFKKLIPMRSIAIVVNAQVQNEYSDWALNEKSPGIREVLGVVSGTMLNGFNSDTIELLYQHFEKMKAIAQKDLKRPYDDYLIQVSFDQLSDPKEREYFLSIPTALALDRVHVDRLRAVARQILLNSPNFQRLLHDLNATVLEPLPDAVPAGSP